MSLALAACVLLLLLLSADQADAARTLGSGASALLAALHLGLALALLMRRRWARGAAVAALAFAAAAALDGPVSAGRVLAAGLPALGSGYLLLPSTARLFRESAHTRLERGTLVAAGVLLVMSVGLLAAVRLGAPAWATHLAALAAGAAWVAVYDLRLDRRLLQRFFRGPRDVAREHRRRFRSAQRAHTRGRVRAAARLLRDLPETSSVATLRGLLRADAPAAGVDRLLYDAGAGLSEPESAELSAQLHLGEADHLLARRARLLDGLVADSLGPEPVFQGDLPRVVSRMAGTVFVTNAEQQARDWWRGARGALTGSDGRAWLSVRLWEAGCPAGAARLGRLAGDATLTDIGELLALLREWPDDDTDAWLAQHAEAMLVIAPLAETTGLLLLDSRIAAGEGALRVARRLKQRVPMMRALRQLWDRYGDLMPMAETRALLAHVAGCRGRSVGSRGRFERWWRRHAEQEERFDERSAAGMELAVLEAWEEAERAFAAAQRALPRRPSAAYNRAVCLLRLGRSSEAQTLLEELTRLDAREALWWMRLGDVCRQRGDGHGSLQAYTSAAHLVGPEEQSVALRLGVLLRQLDREADAQRVLSPAFGADAALLEQSHWEALLAAEDRRWTTRRPEPADADESAWLEPEGGDDEPPIVH